MKISEIFYSIQGEGKYIGVPSIFVRTSYCNLRCKWCDTPYTSWNPEKNSKTIEEILKEINNLSYNSPTKPHIVITGGEPFLQSDLPTLIDSLKNLDYFVTIETNGTRFVSTSADFISLSPKLSNSTPKGRFEKVHEQQRVKIPELKKFVDDKGKDFQLKFVVEGNYEEIKEIEFLLEALSEDSLAKKIYLMPQSRNHSEMVQKLPNLIEICKSTGYNLTTRLHLTVWGPKRGV